MSGYSFPKATRRSSTLLISLLLVAAVFVICAVRLPGIPEDDAYIHRRISLNYAETGHAYFNGGERVMVTSSPLWTILLAVFAKLSPTINFIPGLELLFLLAAAAAAYLIVDEFQPLDAVLSRSLRIAALVLTALALLPSAMEQMETPLAIALMLGGCLGVARRHTWGMPLLFLACFTRYECTLLCLIVGLYAIKERRWNRYSTLACVLISVLGVAWLFQQYGTVIPNTVTAKAKIYALSYKLTFAMLGGSKFRIAACMVLAALWWIYARDKAKATLVPKSLITFGLLLALAYILKKAFIFPWYLQLVWVPLAIGILAWTSTSSVKQLGLGVLTAGTFLFLFAQRDAAIFASSLRGAPGGSFAAESRVHEYLRIGNALHQVCPSGSLMSSEIGGLGWAFPGEILDGVGLASPAALKFHPMRVPEERRSGDTGEIPAGFIAEQRPDVIVTYDYFAESALPEARKLGYVDYSYPLFVKGDRGRMHSLWTAQAMHVLVAPEGRCSARAVDQAVREGIER